MLLWSSRTLAELSHWEATEFRTFLLYTGYFVLQKIAHDDVLAHLMNLNVALWILISDTLSASSEYRAFAHELLLYFVSQSAAIYGNKFLVYNKHSLVHLSTEVELFGKPDNSSAFVFENLMQVLKKTSSLFLVHQLHRLKLKLQVAHHQISAVCLVTTVAARFSTNALDT
jgi:hypothetical protein